LLLNQNLSLTFTLSPVSKNAAFGEVGKQMGATWKTLTADKKAPYDKKAAKDKERYAKEKAAYEKKTAAK
jgi:hypothetical protein